MAKSSAASDITLLSDDPVDNSAFAWHQRVADALDGLIRSHDRGRIVGLFGSWGSGKSTVIDILRKELDPSPAKRRDHTLFLFDAWTHANDPLRRSFYEELLKHYDKHGYVDKKDFEEEANKLSRKQEETETKSTLVIKPIGVIISLTYAATLAYGGYFIKGVVDGQLWSSYPYAALFPLAFFLWPILLLFLPTTLSEKISAYFFNKTSDKVKTKTIKTVDPPPIEFLAAVPKLTCAAQKKHKHKLIIVVDNLDRLLDAKEVLTLWSTIRSFFTLEGQQENIWVIIPLDPAMLQKVFSVDGGQGDINAFIEKTFGATFWVTPPVIVDNHGYFTARAREVFKESLTEQEYEDLFHIYESTRSFGAYGGDNTPRRVKGFLNQLGLLKHLWEGVIPFHTLAVYTLVRDSIKDMATFLSAMASDAAHPIKKPQILAMKDPEWQKHFAAIFYGVEPNKALQAVIEGKLVDALSNGKTEEEFIDLHKIEGFPLILQQTIHKNPYGWSLEYSALSSMTLYLKALEENGANLPASIWGMIINGIGDVDPAKKLDGRSHEVIPFICGKAIEIGCVGKTGKLISRLMIFPEVASPEIKLRYIAVISETIQAVCKLFLAKNASLPFDETRKDASLVLPPVFWPTLAACAEEQTALPYFKAIIEAHPAIADTVYGFGYDNKTMVSMLFKGVQALAGAGYTGPFEKAVEFFADIVKSQKLEEGLEGAAFALGKMSNETIFPKCATMEKITGLLDSGIVYQALNNMNRQNNPSAKAALTGLIMRAHLKGAPKDLANNAEMQQANQVREQILSQPIPDDAFGAALKKVIQEQFTVVDYKSIFSQAQKYNVFAKSGFGVLLQVDRPVIDAQDAIMSFTVYQGFFDVGTETEKNLLLLAEARPDFWGEFDKCENIDRAFVELTKRLVECGIDQNGKSTGILYEKLSALNADAWKQSFAEGLKAPVMEAVRFLTGKLQAQSYGSALGTAMIESIDVLSQHAGTGDAGFFKSLPEHLNRGEVDMFSRRIMSDLLNQCRKNNFNVVEKRLEMFGMYHTDFSAFKENEDDVVSFIFIPAIDGKLLPVLAWMAAQAKGLKTVINKASSQVRGTFEDRMKGAHAESNHPAMQQITSMMEVWSIDPHSDAQEEAGSLKDAG